MTCFVQERALSNNTCCIPKQNDCHAGHHLKATQGLPSDVAAGRRTAATREQVRDQADVAVLQDESGTTAIEYVLVATGISQFFLD
jgi:hypothetical protein